MPKPSETHGHRHLPQAAPWLFWGRTEEERASGTMCWLLESCPDPRCECRDVAVRVFLVPTGEPVERGADASSLGAAQLNARIDFNSGEVAYENPPLQHSSLAERLEREIDGELLDRLYDEWLRAKGRQRLLWPTDGPWREEPPGILAAWLDLFPGDRADHYRLPEGNFIVWDSYCLEPGCNCQEVHFSVFETATETEDESEDESETETETETEDDGRAVEVGAFYVDLRTGDVSRWDTPRQNRPLMRRVLAAIEARHPGRERFSARFARMKEIGLEIRGPIAPSSRQVARNTSARAASTEVGRNDPCPCGSGKKYKKCCLGRSSKN